MSRLNLPCHYKLLANTTSKLPLTQEEHEEQDENNKETNLSAYKLNNIKV
eukprot:m.64557 g.64557  ORF g.64557 m.64557 type:complete len:50 (-) comp11657_c0_seq1:66-215(-)